MLTILTGVMATGRLMEVWHAQFMGQGPVTPNMESIVDSGILKSRRLFLGCEKELLNMKVVKCLSPKMVSNFYWLSLARDWFESSREIAAGMILASTGRISSFCLVWGKVRVVD